MRQVILEALEKRYEAQISEAKANISVFLENGVGVAEHAGTVETIDGEIAKLAEAEDKLQAVKRFGPIVPPKVV